jgi:hypothetical protein
MDKYCSKNEIRLRKLGRIEKITAEMYRNMEGGQRPVTYEELRYETTNSTQLADIDRKQRCYDSTI